MTVKNHITLLLVSVLFIGIGCKSNKQLIGEGPKKPKSAKFLQKKLLANQVQAEVLSAKARITIRDGKEVRKFTSYIRWQKDSVLWMNFKKVSVEAARLKITRDSIFIIDRMNKQFVAEDFSYAQKNFDLPMGFEGLQAMLLGNPVFFNSLEMDADVDDKKYRLLGKSEKYETAFWLDATKYLLRKSKVVDRRNNREISYTLSDYGKNNGQYFSNERELEFTSIELGEVSAKIEWSKVNLIEPIEIKFDIPNHYEQVFP